MDASTWSSQDDFFSALLPELGSPDWHGYNLNVLWDSITSDINDVGPPFRIIVRHASDLPADMAALFEQVSSVFADARSQRAIDVWFIID